MKDRQIADLDRLTTAIRDMSEYERGRLIGIGEGMILARIGAADNAQARQRAVLGLNTGTEARA